MFYHSLSAFYFLLPISYFLSPTSYLQGVFSAHLREGDGAEYRGLLSGRGGGGGGDVPHRVRLQDPGKLFWSSLRFFWFLLFRCRPTPTLEVVATRSDSAPGKSSSRRLHFILLRLVFISSFSGPRSSGVLRRLVRLLRLLLDPYVSWLLPLVFHWFFFILFLWSSWFFFLFCLDLCLFRTSAAVVFPTWTRLCQGRLSSIPATRRLPR